MAEYIDRSELLRIESLLDSDVLRASKTASVIYDQIMYDIEHIPAADVAEVKHGKWIEYLPVLRVGNLQIGCSECGLTNDFKTSYCPNCGAKMDLED